MLPAFLNDKNIELYYETYGNGDPIVFIHPPTMGRVVFKYQRYLSRYYKIILYDLRGHGKSSVGERELNVLEAHSDDLRSLLDHLGINQAVIMGYSAGSSIAQKFALSYPERVKALIFSGGFPKVSTWLLKKEFQCGLALLKNHRKIFLAKFLARSHRNTKQDYLEIFENNAMADAHAAYDYYLESLYYDCTYDLPKIKVPTLALYGSRSFYFHPYIPIYEELLPHVQIVQIDKAFHQLPIRHYQAFNGAVHQFLNGIEHQYQKPTLV